MTELPKYRSHKIVSAARIAALEIYQDKSAKIALIDAGPTVLTTEPGWASRFQGTEEDLGVYVEYEDGYASWSPTKAFEEGYTRI